MDVLPRALRPIEEFERATLFPYFFFLYLWKYFQGSSVLKFRAESEKVSQWVDGRQFLFIYYSPTIG